MRDLGKDLRNLQLALMESNDKPIFYISRSYGNKYIVSKKLFEEQKRVLSIIKKKQVNIALLITCDDFKEYNFFITHNKSDKYLTKKEFNTLKRWLENDC